MLCVYQPFKAYETLQVAFMYLYKFLLNRYIL